ncbi:MAG: hypothetical protein NVS4B6_00440 [Mycobacterium sp.]
MTQVYLVGSVRNVLDDVQPSERDTLTADLEGLPDVPAADVTKVEVDGREYEAAAVSDGWVAVYRDLEPDEAPTRHYERAIAVVDLVPTDAAASSAHANGASA